MFIHTLRILCILFFTPLFLDASQTKQMKCQSGKCSASKTFKIDTPAKKKRDTSGVTVKQLFNVRTVQVKSIKTAKKQTNYGYIVADDAAMVDVLTRYSGFIVTLYANRRYQKVKKGDALAKVYSPEVYKAKQDYLNSLNYNRKRSMPEMLQSAKIKLELLGVSQQEIEKISKTGHADAYTTVFAPISGWIYEKDIRQGDSFSSTKRLFQIVNLETVWMEVKLFQHELDILHTLKHFEVNVKGIEKTFSAVKSLLYPRLNIKEATATLRLIINNTQELLRPGMYAKVNAYTRSQSHIIIPRTAAIRKNGTWYAFLATEFKGEYEPVPIKIRPLDSHYFEVIEGLMVGDSIVNNALFMMDSDAQINSLY